MYCTSVPFHEIGMAIEPGIIEPFADVTSRRENEPLLTIGNISKPGSRFLRLPGCHAPLQHDQKNYWVSRSAAVVAVNNSLAYSC
jgi:hypothetical protein